MVFLCAAPVALVGFIVALTLKEVPLREMTPSTPSISRRLRHARRRDARQGPGKSPSADDAALAGGPAAQHLRKARLRPRFARLWGLIQIYRNNQVFGSARLTDIADA